VTDANFLGRLRGDQEGAGQDAERQNDQSGSRDE
jgi:hypothetical protein